MYKPVFSRKVRLSFIALDRLLSGAHWRRN